MPAMDETALKAVLAQEIRSAAELAGSGLAEERERALDYYQGRPFGNEIQGRSAVVSRDVADTIEWMLPSLLRIFTSADEVVRFEPRQAEDEAAAAQATDYVNWIFNQENQGFLTLYTWFKDALLQKVGIVKVMWEEGQRSTAETYAGLSDDELQMLAADDTVEMTEHSAYPDPAGSGMTWHDVRLRRRLRTGAVKVYPVPPEEFLIARRARDLASAPFVAHRVRKTVSELVAQGYDRATVERLPDHAERAGSPEALARRTGDLPEDNPSRDPAMREVTVTECYVTVDFDGDGIAELRKVTVGGADDAGEILDNVPVDVAPFAALCPVLMPHEFYGISVADLVMDLQLIKSTIMRQMLDGLYLANNPRMLAIENDANLDDLLTSRPGGIVRAKTVNGVRELATTWVGAQAFPMLEYVDGMREGRTGVSKAFMGLDPNLLASNTATAYTQMTNAAQSRVELIARIFAETGVKRLFQLILGLVAKHQQKQRIIRLRGSYVPMDPRGWTNEMDISISVGLGTGNRDQQLVHLAMIAGKQEQILAAAGPDNPLVGLDNLYATYARMIESAGLKSATPFFKDPAQAPPKPPAGPPPPDPRTAEAQARIALEQAKAASQSELARARLAEEMALARARLEAELALDRERLAAELALKRETALLRTQQPELPR